MDEEKQHIFFYGGDDTQWIKQFEEKASALKKVTNSIELGRIKNGSEGEDNLWKFWNRVDSFFLGWNNIKSFLLSEAGMKTGSSTVMSTILKLLSCETASRVVLCKGSKLVNSGHGTIILNVMQKLSNGIHHLRCLNLKVLSWSTIARFFLARLLMFSATLTSRRMQERSQKL